MPSKDLRSFIFIGLFGVFSLLTQTVWLPRLTFWSTFPNLILVLIALTGLFKGPLWGSCTGIALGIILGLTNQHFLLTVILWGLFGLILGFLKSDVFNNVQLLTVMGCVFGTFLAYFLYWGLSALFLKEAFYTPLETPLYSSLLNALTAFLLFPLFKFGLDKAKSAHE